MYGRHAHEGSLLGGLLNLGRREYAQLSYSHASHLDKQEVTRRVLEVFKYFPQVEPSKGVTLKIDDEMPNGNEEQHELLQEIINNTKLSEGRLTLPRDLEMMESKPLEDIYKKFRLARYIPGSMDDGQNTGRKDTAGILSNLDARSVIQITDALKMQMEVQTRFHEQLEVVLQNSQNMSRPLLSNVPVTSFYANKTTYTLLCRTNSSNLSVATSSQGSCEQTSMALGSIIIN